MRSGGRAGRSDDLPTLAPGRAHGNHAIMSTRIAAVEAHPVVYPTRGWFKFLEGPRGRRPARASVVVKITADNGVVGWGQSIPLHRWSYETLETVLTTLQHYLAPELVGLDVFDPEAVHAAMNRVIAPSFSTGQPICKAGVDLALFDLMGRLTGRTAAQLWNRPARDRLTLSWTVNVRTLEEAEQVIAEGRALGYRHFNVKVAPDPQFDVELCRLVKRLVPDGFLWADANGGYDEATALEVAPKLADAGVAVLEQPLPAARLTGYRRLRQQGALPILMDEGVVSHVELEEFIRLELLDGVAMKVARCGGLTEARKQIQMLENAGLMWLGSGLTDPDLSLAACLQLYAAHGLEKPAALNGPQFLRGTILREPIRVENGEALVPQGPGLGVEVDPERLTRPLTDQP